MSKRKLAIITGGSLILMALAAGFSIGYVFPEIYTSEQPEAIKANIIESGGLYHYMLMGIFVILMLDVIVSYTLYQYFKQDNKIISAISSALRIIYTLIFGLATFYLYRNLNLNEIDNDSVYGNFKRFEFTWSIGLIIFGIHLILVGVLMKLHQRIPKVLWLLALLGGVSYMLVHGLKSSVGDSDMISNLEMILTAPMALGELGLAFWLLIKGGKISDT